MAKTLLQRSGRVLWDVGILSSLRVVAIIIGLGYVKVYTNRLTPDALGIFFYLGTLSYLLNALIFVPFDFYLQAYCARAGEQLPLRHIVKMSAGVLASGLALVAILGAILIVFGQLAAIDVLALYLVAILLFGCTSLRNLLNNRNHRKVVATALVFEAGGRISAFLVLTGMFTASGRLLFASAGAALLIELIGLLYYSSKKLQWNVDAIPPQSPPLIATTAPVSVSAACNLAQLQSYRTLYPWAGAPASAAIYAVVANVGSAGMAAAGQIFAQILLPRVYQTHGQYARTYIRWALLLTVTVAVIAWLAAPVLVRFITSPHYAAYASLIVFGVMMEGANIIVGAVTVRSMLQNDTRRLMMWNIVGAITAVIGYVIALYILPGSPAAIGVPLILSQIVVLSGLLAGARRKPS